MNQLINAITLGRVTGLVKKLIAKITNRDSGTIFLRLKLRDAPLRFTEEGVRALAGRLNDVFMAQDLALTPDMVQPSETVEDLVDLVWDNIPDSKKIREDA